MQILVTGGAGYIGSFMTRKLLELGFSVVVVDDLSRGEAAIIDSRATFEKGTLLDKTFLQSVFSKHQIDAVIHFAGFISMGESMKHPDLYFQNNTQATLVLLDALIQNAITKIIFSSTAGVYGNPVKLPIPEDHPTNPTNPYGESKLMVERMLMWYQRCYGLQSVSLRYFNACGASLDGNFGEQHTPETHLIPCAMHSILTNSPFSLFGTDYDTDDGSCIRDYIHVLDLIEAHIAALEKLKNTNGSLIYNVGTGNGYSNKQVLSMIEKVTGKVVPLIEKERREGDATELVADNTKISSELGFRPQYSDLETIVSSAWKWHRRASSQ